MHSGRGDGLCREYERESLSTQRMDSFVSWLRARCSHLDDGSSAHVDVLRALACGPSRRVCSFRSMISYGSHYRVEDDEGGAPHVTYDCGVAELRKSGGVAGFTDGGGGVEVLRVGTLKDVLVLNYNNTNIVLMVVSWLTKDTELQPRLRRDAHGFWLANVAARPRCNQNPYILPSLASQVLKSFCVCMLKPCEWRCLPHLCRPLKRDTIVWRFSSCPTRQILDGVSFSRKKHGEGEYSPRMRTCALGRKNPLQTGMCLHQWEGKGRRRVTRMSCLMQQRRS